tara:strand:+ start:2822 stop:4387 length:1566 start_codon:yes stop_codon:yes gene_type:complete
MFTAEFEKHLTKFTTSPFIFVGSGISRRYINSETWYLLLEKMVNELELTKPFEYYVSNSNNDLPKVASLMAEEFNSVWWTSPKYETSRTAYSKLARKSDSPLKFEICKYLEGKEKNINTELSSELNLLKKINIDGIITTNWDLLLESLFPDFTRYVGQEELIFSEIYSIGELYKIHGCVSNPESLTLTDADYSEFHNRNSYLAAKLLTIFVEHPVIFMGYSLDDANVQEILKSIIKCLTKNNIEKLKDRLIFCQWKDGNETQISDSTLLISDTVIPIKLISLSNYVDVFTVLANNKKRLPIKVLRQMKGMVYEFVKTSDPSSKVYVSDSLDDLENRENVEFVYGVGLKQRFSEVGITGIDTRDLYRDIILDNKWDANKISKLLLPTLTTKYYPPFKYLRQANFLTVEGVLDTESDVKEFTPKFIEKINSIELSNFQPAASYSSKKAEINEKYSSFEELQSDCEFFHVLMFTPLLEPSKINLESLKTFLKANLDKLLESKYGTHYRKIICLYDYLKYKVANE